MIGKKSGLFDERSGRWIKILKVFTMVMFWLYIAAGAVLFLAEVSEDAGIGLVCLLGGVLLAFVQLVLNMLIIQLLNNVQTIREKLEQK